MYTFTLKPTDFSSIILYNSVSAAKIARGEIADAIFNDSWPSSDYSMRNTTNQCTYRYISLLYYKQRSLLHVSATYFAIFREVFFEVQNVKFNLTFYICRLNYINVL